MVKVGVVGLGAMGQHHVRLYSQLDCELVGIADADPVRAREIGEEYGLSYYSDYHELLSKIDAVSIVVPTSLHHKVAMDFLKEGVHCLIEKPIASTIKEAMDIIQQAEQSRAKLMVGHIERFNPAVAKLKEIIDGGTLGELMIISTRRVGPFVPRIRDVGILIDTASHDIDIARYLIGKEPANIYCKAGKHKHPREDHAILVLDFGCTTACIEANWFTPHKVRSLVATGSKGIAYLDYIEQNLTVYNGAHYTNMDEQRKTEPLQLELEHFIDCIGNNTQPLIDGEDGLKTLQIALQAEQAGDHV